MNWLARLKNKECPSTHPTETTKTGFGGVLGVSVVFVGTPKAHIENSLPVSEAANDPATRRPATPPDASPPSPDAYCWPNSSVMNDRELEATEARLKLFARRGLTDTQVDTLVDLLATRDREQDDRRTCLECSHCTGSAPLAWRCGNHRAAGAGRELGSDIAVMLQRCVGFRVAQ